MSVLVSHSPLLLVDCAGSISMLHWAISLHHCMFKSLQDQIPKLEVRPTIMVVDFATYGGFDIADYFSIPFG